MALPLKNWATRDKFTYFFSGGALLMVAIVLGSLHLSRPKIKSKQDIKFFNGQLTEHQYYYSNRGGGSCWFKIKDCSNSFEIDGKNLKFFDISEFENLADGSSVTIGVSKSDFSRLNSGIDQIFIYSLSHNDSFIMDYNDTIRNYNSDFIYYPITALLFTSFILIYLGCISNVKSLL